MAFPQPLWNKRALLTKDTLVVCDLHIGYERELEKKGVHIPSITPNMVEDIRDMMVQKGVKRLVINGDLKHTIPQGTWQEYKEIPEAMDRWLKVVDEVHVVYGNHDGGVDEYLPSEVYIHDSRGYHLDGVGYFHGHARPDPEVLGSDILVTAHSHPAVTLIDSLGQRNKLHCWVRVKYSLDGERGEVVIMPSFNHLLGGTSINEDGYLGPFFRDIEVIEEDVYLLDGTPLGGISSKDGSRPK